MSNTSKAFMSSSNGHADASSSPSTASASASASEASIGATPIVIDIGSGLLKAGWAGNDAPTSVQSTLIAKLRATDGAADEDGVRAEARRLAQQEPEDMVVGNRAMIAANIHTDALDLSHPVVRGEVVDWDAITRMLEHIYRDHLRVESSQHPVLFSEPSISNHSFRNNLSDIMFRHFRVPALATFNSSVLALFSTGRTRGIVLDIGEGSTHVVPVFEGYAIPHAIQRLNVAGSDITQHMQHLLAHDDMKLRLDIARDIKEKLCTVQLKENNNGTSTTQPCKYELPDGHTITMTNQCKYEAGELLFEPSLSIERVIGTSSMQPEKGVIGVHKLLVDSINTCDTALQNDLWQNIVLSGGTSMLHGLPERLCHELQCLVPPGTCFKVSQEPRRRYGTWIGGSMLASLDTFADIKVTKRQFEDADDIVHKKSF